MERRREARCPVDELSTWFGPLNARLGAEAEQGLGPASNEVGLLLEMGKLAAEAGPQRFYALLTGFAVGRALGRAERDDATLDTRAFLQKALKERLWRCCVSAAGPYERWRTTTTTAPMPSARSGQRRRR